jgi:hypothetical protein
VRGRRIRIDRSSVCHARAPSSRIECRPAWYPPGA